MYIAYLPKSKGEKLKDRKINNFLEFYVNSSSNDYSVISAPGYMSTSQSTTKKYLNSLSDILNTAKEKLKSGF